MISKIEEKYRIKNDENQLQNNEFTKLQREYRNMELNRKAYADESHQVMRRQQVVIDKLKNDNEKIKNDLQLFIKNNNHPTKMHLNTIQQEPFIKLKEIIDNYIHKITNEQKECDLINDQIHIMKRKVINKKKNMGGINAAEDNQLMINKQIRILENRLDKALIKFNESLANNKLLRETIDNLRRERIVFDTIYKKLEKELIDKRKQMANIIEISNIAYEQRDHAQMELNTILQLNKTEKEEYDKQINEINDTIEELKKKHTNTIYSINNNLNNLNNNNNQILGITNHITNDIIPNKTTKNDIFLQDELTKKRMIPKSPNQHLNQNLNIWGIAKDKINVQVSVERVQNFEEAFHKIKLATNITDLDELVQNFIKNEDQNFSLFNYINEQNNDIEKIQENIQILKDEELKYTLDNGEGLNQHKQILKDLENQLQITESNSEKYEIKCTQEQKIINLLKLAIESLFKKINMNIDPSHMINDIIMDSNVTETNMMQCMGMIEHKTNDILQLLTNYKNNRNHILLQSNEIINHSNPMIIDNNNNNNLISFNTNIQNPNILLGTGPLTPMGQEQIQINPPDLDDYSSDDHSSKENDINYQFEDKTRTLTSDELRSGAIKIIRRKSILAKEGKKNKKIMSNKTKK